MLNPSDMNNHLSTNPFAFAVCAASAILFGIAVLEPHARADEGWVASDTVEAQRRALLHRESMTNYGIAVRCIEQEDQWHTGLAYLAQSLRVEPDNALAAARLHSTLLLHGKERCNWPRVLLRPAAGALTAGFSPDGSRILTLGGHSVPLTKAEVFDAVSGKRLVSVTHGSHTCIKSARFSPDGTRILTTGDDQTARVWDAADGRALFKPVTHGDDVLSAQFSSDGRRILTVSADGVVQTFDASTGSTVGVPTGSLRSRLVAAAFSPDGGRIALAQTDGISIVEVPSERLVSRVLHNGSAGLLLQFSPDGKLLLTTRFAGSRESQLRVWDVSTGVALGKAISAGQRSILPDVLEFLGIPCAQWSPEGVRILTTDGSCARLWDARKGEPLGPPLDHGREVVEAQFHPDGTRVVTAGWDGTVRAWDPFNGVLLGQPLPHAQAPVGSARFSPDGRQIVTADWDGLVRTWAAPSVEPVEKRLPGNGDSALFEYSPDGGLLVEVSSTGVVQVWDVATQKTVGRPMAFANKLEPTDFVHFSPDGRRLLSFHEPEDWQVWDIATGTKMGRFLRRRHGSETGHFSPDGARIRITDWEGMVVEWDAFSGGVLDARGLGEGEHGAVAGAFLNADGTRIVTVTHSGLVEIREVATGLPVGASVRVGDGFRIGCLSGDANRMAVVHGNKLEVWEVATGKALSPPIVLPAEVDGVALSADGLQAATWQRAEGVAVRIWDARTGKPAGPGLPHDGAVTGAVFNADGTQVLTTQIGGLIRLWQIPSGGLRSIHSSPWPHRLDENACFGPDGSLFRVTSGRVWEVTGGRPLSGAIAGEVAVAAAKTSPDGSRLVTSGHDGAVRIWEAASGKPVGEPLLLCHRTVSIQFSMDGKRIVTFSLDNVSRVWDAATGKPVGRPVQHNGRGKLWEREYAALDFNRDRSRVLGFAGGETPSRKIDVWLATGTLLSSIVPSGEGTQEFTAARLSPEGDRVVTVSQTYTPDEGWQPGEVRVWDASSGRPFGEALAHGSAVDALQFHPNGTRLVLASGGVLSEWEVEKNPPSSLPVPVWMLRYAEAIAGCFLNRDGEISVLPESHRVAILQEALPEEGKWAALIRQLYPLAEGLKPAAQRGGKPEVGVRK
jgi:WD40 repeat protein